MEKIRATIESLIKKLGVESAELEVSHDNDVWKISINTPDYALASHDNERFEALNHIIKRIIAKECGDDAKSIIDVNGLRAKREEALKAKATIIADRARAFKRDVEMEPMSSYERMLVHSYLEGAPNIKTESVGEGRARRLVVKYIEE